MHGSTFQRVDLSGSRFHLVDLSGVTMRGVDLLEVDIDGWVRNVTINGVDIGPLIEAELDRRHPERRKLRPTDADGYREAWDLIEAMWPPVVERARRLRAEQLHERVDEEWSFIETMRHLVFATDAWVKRAILLDPAPYDALDLPHTEMGVVEGVPNDTDARPGLDEVLTLRADRMAVVRRLVDGLTDTDLVGTTEPNPAPGYPAPERYPLSRCLGAVLNEEWAHRMFAERDLAVLEERAAAG